jgi:hypothetical protein
MGQRKSRSKCKNLERRKKIRFPLQREMRYKVLDAGREIGRGSGRTLDISSSGAAFTTEGYIAPGTLIEITISWPVLLDGQCKLRLCGSGPVIYSTAGMAACRITQFGFRTQGKGASATAVARAAA